MESRLPRFRLMDHHLKDILLSPIPSRSHISTPFESYKSRQLVQRDSGLPVAEFSKRQVVTKKLNQESRERGDSKIPVYTTLAKSSSIQDGGQRIQLSEQRTAHENRQDRINSVELDSVNQSKPNAIFTFGHSSSGRSGQRSTGYRLPEETLIAAEKENDETETQTAEWLGKNEMFGSSSRVLELTRLFEAFEGEQGKRKLVRQYIRKGDMQKSHLKDELNQQKSDSTAPTLDEPNELLTNEIASALKKSDLAAFPPLQQSISNNLPYSRWTSIYPRSAPSLSTQQSSTVKKRSKASFSRERLDQRFHKSCENTHENHYERLVVIEETTHEQLPFKNKTTSTDERFLENGNNKTNIDSGGENGYDCLIASLHKRNSNREAVKTNSGERSLNYNRTRQASKKLDQPEVMDGVINPVGRVHSEPLTSSSLIKRSRAESPRRRIFETKSDKMVSHTANSGHTSAKEEGCDKDRALYKQRNECRAEVHRSLTDHRTEGTRVSAKNKYMSHRTTTFNDSTESCKQHQQSDESLDCLNAYSRQEQDDLVGENSQLSGVVEDNEAIQLITEAQVDNIDEQKQPRVTESTSLMTSPVRNGRLLSTLPLPSSSAHDITASAEPLQPLTALAQNREYPVTMDRYCSRPDCSSYRNQLTYGSTYGSVGDCYLSSSCARGIQMRGIASDQSYELSPSGIAQPATQKKTRLSFDSESPVDSSSHCVQLRSLSPSQSLLQSHAKRMKASCEFSESKLKTITIEEVATDPIQHLLCCRTTSKEALTEEMAQTIKSDNSLLQRQSKTSLKVVQSDSATSFTAKHRIPNKAAVQSSANLSENDQQTEMMLIPFHDEKSEDKLEVKNEIEFVRSNHHGHIGQNENMMSCTEFLVEEHKPIEEPVRNSLVSGKPVNRFISMYRTQGPIIAKFSDRTKTVDLIDSKTTLVCPRNTSFRKRDLYQPQSIALETCKPTMNETKPILRNDSSSKPLTKRTEKGDGHVRKCDDRHQSTDVFRRQPKFIWRQKQQISPFLPTSCSTDSFITDSELNAKSLHPQVQHSRDTLRRRQYSDIDFKVINTAASACTDDSASSIESSANFRTVFRQSRQQLAEEQEDWEETSSVEELVKGYNHPLHLSENESEIDSHNDCNRRCNVDIVILPGNTGNGETELIEQESTEITRQTQIDQNRMLFEGTHILHFRQRVSTMLIAIIFILIFYMKIFPIVQSTIFRKSDS